MSERKKWNPITGCLLPIIGVGAVVYGIASGALLEAIPASVGSKNQAGQMFTPEPTYTPVPIIPPEKKVPDAAGCLPEEMTVINDAVRVTRPGEKLAVTWRNSSGETIVYAFGRGGDPTDLYLSEDPAGATLFIPTGQICNAHRIP